MKFYYDKKIKYTNRQIVRDADLEGFLFAEKGYLNIDSPDSINGHIIYELEAGENIPSYVVEDDGKRWYVSGITQLRTGKYQISLIRDIISEGELAWRNEQAYISAGTATDYNKYKKWGLPFTNTKIKERPLLINGEPSFFVFYTNTQTIDDSGAIAETDLKLSSTLVPSGTQVNVNLDSLTDYEYYKYINPTGSSANSRVYIPDENVKFAFATANKIPNYTSGSVEAGFQGKWGIFSINKSTNTLSPIEVTPGITAVPPSFITFLFSMANGAAEIDWTVLTEIFSKEDDFVDVAQNAINSIKNEYAQANNSVYVSAGEAEGIENDINKVFLDKSSNKIYKLKKEVISYDSDIESITFAPNGQIAQTFISGLNNVLDRYSFGGGFFMTTGIPAGNMTFSDTKTGDSICRYYFEEVESVNNFEFNFKSNVLKLPKSAVRCVNIKRTTGVVENDALGQALMQMSANATNLNNDTGQIIDIQFLPFSLADSASTDFLINGQSLTAEFLNLDDYSFLSQNQSLTNINKETDTIKITSPSRATQFVFSPYNNDGNMNFDVKITIRPFSTVIYIRPQTTGLLMQNFDDKNCLIIDEDFSLSLLSSEWSNYVRQNRNYKNTFEREIQGREYERSWERKIEEAQARSDEWTARNMSAQKAQAYTGNLPILSSIVGAIGTAFADKNYMNAAQLDREYNEALYQQSLSLSRDLFSYQLDNLKSQPTMPSKITTIDIKFQEYCIIEYYSTNPTELNAISNYYNYNGNRIDAFGTFNSYWGSFVRGKIIISNNYTQPELNELNRRLQTGIFTGGIS